MSDNMDLQQGGVKFDGEKVRLDLIPPDVVFGLGRVLTHGAKKYDSRNWEKGMRYGRSYSALLRHLLAWWAGEAVDPDSGLNHIDQVVCNAMFLSHFEHNSDRYKDFDDRPPKEEVNVLYKDAKNG